MNRRGRSRWQIGPLDSLSEPVAFLGSVVEFAGKVSALKRYVQKLSDA